MTDEEIQRLRAWLEINHERHADKIRQGVHAKKKAKRPKKTAQRPPLDRVTEPEDSLF